jgi:hypothetical protein
LDPTVRPVALSQSLPTPNTNDAARVVVNVPEGAPDAELLDCVAPIAPAPFVPLVSAPLKETTVIDAAADCTSVAVTVTFDRMPEANARQISESPRRTFVRLTSDHVTPPPLTPLTVCPAAVSSELMNARSSSFPAVVENAFDVSVFDAVERSPKATTSITGGIAFATVTTTGADDARLPAASWAVAVSVCDPFPIVVVFQVTV